MNSPEQHNGYCVIHNTLTKHKGEEVNVNMEVMEDSEDGYWREDRGAGGREGPERGSLREGREGW